LHRPLRLNTADVTDFESAFARRLFWSGDTDAAIEQRVQEILADVQARGDAAVLEYTRRFDRVFQAPSVAALEVTQAELKAAFDSMALRRRDALEAGGPRVRTTTRRRRRPVVKAGVTVTTRAACWARRSRHWTGSASTCPAARRPIRPRC
jgi:histidinol dehydrogenase